MHLSRIRIVNFRNFRNMDVNLAGNVVVLGENRVGKSNMLYALRLVLDPTLSDSARQLSRSDFWDGIETLSKNDKIVVSLEIKEFEGDLNMLSILTDFRLDDDPSTVRLTYEFRPKADLESDPASDEDYVFVCYGGEDEKKQFGHALRRRLAMELLPALRDVEGDLAAWRRSPLRPLIENAFRSVDQTELKDIQSAIEEARERLREFETVEDLEKALGESFAAMSGPSQDIKPSLGFGPTDVSRLFRSISLLTEGGRRTIHDESLGSANVAYLTLKELELRRLLDENQRDHTLLAIEEPEAHLHPHLQRTVYRHFFDVIGNQESPSPLSMLLTTHSPHIASVAPLRSVLLLRDTTDEGSIGRSTADIVLTDTEVADLTRYLDVTRAELLFARGVILVEGDAERFLLPVLAENVGHSLDQHGITICSVGGTNFRPYVKLLTGLGIPFSVITDWDPRPGREALGINRSIKIVKQVERGGPGTAPGEMVEDLKARARTDQDDFRSRCMLFGVFLNEHTLEVDLFAEDAIKPHIITTLREHRFGERRQGLIDRWETDSESLDVNEYLAMIEAIGKGRFAQRLSSYVTGVGPPDYIMDAIDYVAQRI